MPRPRLHPKSTGHRSIASSRALNKRVGVTSSEFYRDASTKNLWQGTHMVGSGWKFLVCEDFIVFPKMHIYPSQVREFYIYPYSRSLYY